MKWMIYGANGYTGKLISHEAKRRGLKPILAGRSRDTIEALANELQLESRIFSLEDSAATVAALKGIELVLHCAGPFSKTSGPMATACLKAHAHYLDITGEIGVFEALRARDKEAVKANCVLLPGVGFDVVPSDCLAALLAKQISNPEVLELAMAGNFRPSPGTLKTVLSHMAEGGSSRRNGKLVEEPVAAHTREVKFPNGKFLVSSIPWGDVSTAFVSTAIPNITTYGALPEKLARFARVTRPFGFVMGSSLVQKFLMSFVEKKVPGPTESERNENQMYLWGRVANKEGQAQEATATLPDGYTLTVLASLLCVQKMAQGKIAPGFQTPSRAFGADLIKEIPGVTLQGV